MTSHAVPEHALELRSTLSDDGIVTLAVRSTEVPAPGDDQVVVRVDAAPINPSDLGMLFAGGDADASLAAGDGMHPGVSLPVSAAVLAAQRARLGKAMPVGNEGGGVVVVESLAHAQARGATPIAEILGGALTADAFHISAPEPTSIASVLRFAETDSGANSACANFALPSAICCACARVASADVWIVSPSAFATGASVSACS